jgi:hypothetical protein
MRVLRSSQAQQPFREFAECTSPTGCIAYVVNAVADAGHRVAGRRGEPGATDRVDDVEVVEVVADVGELRERGARLVEHARQVSPLVAHAGPQADLELVGARRDQRGRLAGDDRGRDAVAAQALDAHPIAHRVRLHRLAGRRHVDRAIGQDAVVVGDDERDAPRAGGGVGRAAGGRTLGHHTVKPPSTTRFAPVMYDDASLARNTAAPA